MTCIKIPAKKSLPFTCKTLGVAVSLVCWVCLGFFACEKERPHVPDTAPVCPPCPKPTSDPWPHVSLPRLQEQADVLTLADTHFHKSSYEVQPGDILILKHAIAIENAPNHNYQKGNPVLVLSSKKVVLKPRKPGQPPQDIQQLKVINFIKAPEVLFDNAASAQPGDMVVSNADINKSIGFGSHRRYVVLRRYPGHTLDIVHAK